jgi:hypothetical protein
MLSSIAGNLIVSRLGTFVTIASHIPAVRSAPAASHLLPIPQVRGGDRWVANYDQVLDVATRGPI